MKSLMSVFLASVCVSGCAPFAVVRQATPNPFVASPCHVDAQPLSFDGMKVGDWSEQEWLAKKPAEETASYNTDKATMAENFKAALVEYAQPNVRSADASYLLKPRLTFWEPGFYSSFVNKDSEASVTVEITDKSGAVLDEITAKTRVASSFLSPATGLRMHTAGKQLGKAVAAYLNSRLECGKK